MHNITFHTELDLRSVPGDGKEHEILKLYPGYVRKSGRLWDYVNPSTGEKLEVKKMRLWSETKKPRKTTPKRPVKIDLSKFVNLTEEERAIKFHVFYFNTSSGSVIEVIKSTYGEIADKFVPKGVQSAVSMVYSKLGIKRSQKRRHLYGPDLVIDLDKLKR